MFVRDDLYGGGNETYAVNIISTVYKQQHLYFIVYPVWFGLLCL